MKIGSGRFRLLLLSMVGALLLTACELRVFADLVIEEDESGTIAVELSMDSALAALADTEFGGEPVFDEDMLPDGWSMAVVSEDGFQGISATAAFESLTGLREILAALVASEDQPSELGLLDFLAAGLPTREDDTFRFSLTIPGGIESLLGEGFAEGSLPVDLAMVDQVLDIRVSLTLPGEIVSHNADLHTVDLLVWNLSLTDPGRTLEAVSRLPQPGAHMAIVWAAVVAALVVVIVLVVMVRSRRRREGSAEPVVEQPGGREAVD